MMFSTVGRGGSAVRARRVTDKRVLTDSNPTVCRGRGRYIGTPKEHGEHVSQFKTHSMFEAFILKENKYLCPPKTFRTMH